MDTTEKRPRVRSVAYPSYTIKESFELTKRINQQFGNLSFNKREDIAEQLEMSVGNLMMKLSTATQYGLLELKSKEGYKPTDKFTSVYKPLSDDEKKKSEIGCLLSPELYVKLIEKYKGQQLPAIGGLAILLYRSFKVSEDASTRAAKTFLENLEDLQLIDENNRLKADAFSSESIEVKIEESIKELTIFENHSINKQLKNSINVEDISSEIVNVAPPIPVFLKGNRIAKVYMPIDYTNDDIDYVIKVIGIYKRQE